MFRIEQPHWPYIINVSCHDSCDSSTPDSSTGPAVLAALPLSAIAALTNAGPRAPYSALHPLLSIPRLYSAGDKQKAQRRAECGYALQCRPLTRAGECTLVTNNGSEAECFSVESSFVEGDMPYRVQRATCRSWLHLLTAPSSPITTPIHITRLYRRSTRSLSSTSANDRPQSAASQQTVINGTEPSASPSTPSSRTSPNTSRTLTPAILSQFHGVSPATARNLIHTILQTHSSTLTPADYGTLIHLAHSLTPPPHTLVLSLHTHYTGRHSLSAAPDELFQYVLPVLHHHDRHADVLRLYTWMAQRRLMDQVMLGVLLRACDVRQDGKLAWQLWEKYRAPQPTAEVRRVEEAREQEEKAAGKSDSKADRRREGAPLARFVEESLFPRSSYHGVNRSGLSSPTSAFNLLHYTYIVSALRHHPYHANQALSVLWHMHHHGVRPDSLFYNRLLGTLTTKLLPACCLYVLRDMEAHSMPIDGRVYYFVITAHAMRGRWTEVVRLIAEMRDRGLDVNEHVYEAAVVCCAETGQVQRAKDIVAEMQHRAVPLTWRCYTALITLAGQAGEWQWVLQLFDMGKERIEFRKQLLANDTVIEALMRAEERGESTTLPMTAEQVYRRYFPEVIGPRGLWLLMRKGVEAERLCGVLECSKDVRQLLMTATTPLSSTYIGRMQIRQEKTAEHGRPRKQQSTMGSRHYRLFVPNTSVEEAIASVDILLLCMLYQAAQRSTTESHTGAVDETDARWREHLSRLPACVNSLVVVTPKDTQPSRELEIRRQLHDDPIYAATATHDSPFSEKMNGEAEMVTSEKPTQEAAKVAEESEAAANEQQKDDEEEAAQQDDDTELATPALSSSERASGMVSDPAVEAVEQAEADLKEKEVELPSLGHFVVHTVNSLLSLVTKPLQRRGPGSVLEMDATDTPPTTHTAAAPIFYGSSSTSASSATTRTSQLASSALAGAMDLSSSQADARKARGLVLLSTMQQHLRTLYGIETRVADDKGFHRLTLTPQQLTKWVQKELEHRQGRPSQRAPQSRTRDQRSTRGQYRVGQTKRAERWSGAKRDASGVGAEAENATQRGAHSVVVT